MAARYKRRKLSLDREEKVLDPAINEITSIQKSPNIVEPDPSASLQHRRSLFVRSLPLTATTETLTKLFSESYPLKHAVVVVDPKTKQSKGYGFVTFTDAGDAQDAKKELDGLLVEGKKIRVTIAEPRHREAGESQQKVLKDHVAPEPSTSKDKEPLKDSRPPKLIVRNLPWTLKEPEQLASLFRSYGKVKHATIPQKKPGLQSGFGFVVLRGKKNAEKALAGVNGKVVDGRTLAVDWAVEKGIWETLQKGEDDGKSSPDGVVQSIGVEDASSIKSEDRESYMADVKVTSDAEYDSVSGKSEPSITSTIAKPESREDVTTLFIRNLPFTATDDTLGEHFRQFGPVRYARVVLDHATERPRGTGFVCFYRQEDATTCHRDAPRPQLTSRPIKGKMNAATTSSLKSSILKDLHLDPSGKFTLEGRVLQISRAVNRNEALRLTAVGDSSRDVRDRDKRRLYLLSEGTVPSNSPLYSQLAPSEVKMREDSAKQRQALVKSNPALNLSLTRLSIRNIPRSVTSKDLKALAREAVVGFASDVKAGLRQQLSKEELLRGGDEMRSAERDRKLKGKGIVKQAKIVFEGREGSKVTEDSGAGRSRGYGFVEYVSHRWALMGLRWLNGHAVGRHLPHGEKGNMSKEDSKERKKRIIVEFALENSQVVGRRREREIKAREASKGIAQQKAIAGRLVPSKDDLFNVPSAAPPHQGTKRKRYSDVQATGSFTKPSSRKSSRQIDQSEESNKLSKRQRIVSKKRTMRRATRNKGKG